MCLVVGHSSCKDFFQVVEPRAIASPVVLWRGAGGAVFVFPLAMDGSVSFFLVRESNLHHEYMFACQFTKALE